MSNYNNGIPDCCKKCQRLGTDFDEFRDISSYYCLINIKFPTKKQTCKKIKYYNKESK